MEHLVQYKLDVIDRITPVYNRLIALSKSLTGNNAVVKSSAEGVSGTMNKLTETARKSMTAVSAGNAGIKETEAALGGVSNAYDRMHKYAVLRFTRVKQAAGETGQVIRQQIPAITATGNVAAKTGESITSTMQRITAAGKASSKAVAGNGPAINRSVNNLNRLNGAHDRMSRYAVLRFLRVKKAASDTHSEISRQLPIFDRLRAKLGSVERKALGVGSSIKRGLGGIVNYLGPVGAMIGSWFAVGQIKQTFDVLTQAASDLNESANKSKEVFGDSFKSIQEFAGKAAKTIGMSQSQTYEAAASFGNLFSNVGFGSQATAKLSESTVRLAADLASFNNMSMDESLQALMSTLKGETEPAMRFGVLLNEMTVKQKAFEMGLIKTTKGALTPAIKTQAIYGLVLEQSKKAQGDFARTSEDEANKTRILAAVQADLQAKLGQKLLPMKLKLTDIMIRAVEWISANTEKLMSYGRTALQVGGFLLGLYTAARTILSAKAYYLTVARALWHLRKSAVYTAIASKLLAAGQTMALLATNGMARGLVLAKLKMIAFNVVARLSPFGWIATAIGAIILIVKHWDKVKAYMIALGKWIWDHHPFKWMIDLIDRVFPGFKDNLVKVFETVKTALIKVATWIYDKVIKPLFGWLADLLDIKIGVSAEANLPKGGDRGEMYRNRKEKECQYNYDGVLGLMGGGTEQKGKSVSEGTETLVKGGNKEVKNINIRIDNLVRQMEFSVTKNIRETAGQMKDEVVKALLTAVNDVNYQ